MCIPPKVELHLIRNPGKFGCKYKESLEASNEAQGTSSKNSVSLVSIKGLQLVYSGTAHVKCPTDPDLRYSDIPFSAVGGPLTV